MTIYRVIVCALAFSIAAATPVAAAEKKAPAKAAAKKAPPGRTETLACRLGTEDRHARIAVVVLRGRTDSFAYYSKWKPRTCSVYLQRKGDMYSKWADNGNITTVSLEKGAFLIEHKPGEYHFIFRDIDRERYCGMDGVINGSLTIKRGSSECVLDGELMVEGTPLGQANVVREPEGPLAAGASDAAPAAPDASSAEKAPVQKPAAAEPASKQKPTAAEPASKQKPTAAEHAPKQKPIAAEPTPQQKPAAAAEPAPQQKPAAAESAPEQKPVVAEPAPEQKPAAAEPPPAAKPQSAAAEKPPADKKPETAAEKPAEAKSGSIGAFFRSLKPNPPAAGSPP